MAIKLLTRIAVKVIGDLVASLHPDVWPLALNKKITQFAGGC